MGSGTITTFTDPNTTITNLGIGDNIFQWTIPNGVCTTSDLATIHIEAAVSPSFLALPDICSGNTAPTLPTTFNNGISGTWYSLAVSNLITGTYTNKANSNVCNFKKNK